MHSPVGVALITASQFCICSHLVIWAFPLLRTSRSYVVCRNSTSNTHTFPVFSWHMLSLLFVAIFFHISQLDFSLFTQQHKKTSILMAPSPPLSLELLSRQHQQAMERKAEPKWCTNILTCSQWPAGTIQQDWCSKRSWKISKFNKVYACLSAYTQTLSLRYGGHFPLAELSTTVPQLFPFSWLQNCTNSGACALPSHCIVFMSHSVSLGESLHTYLMTLYFYFNETQYIL